MILFYIATYVEGLLTQMPLNHFSVFSAINACVVEPLKYSYVTVFLSRTQTHTAHTTKGDYYHMAW